MSDLQNELNRAVQGFVGQVTEIARRAAREMLDSALSGRNGRSTVGLGRGRGRGAKRTSGDLDKLGTQFTAFVAKHPGLRIEQINKQLGTTTKDLALPIRKLISENRIKAKGQKRSTTYFPGKKKAKN